MSPAARSSRTERWSAPVSHEHREESDDQRKERRSDSQGDHGEDRRTDHLKRQSTGSQGSEPRLDAGELGQDQAEGACYLDHADEADEPDGQRKSQLGLQDRGRQQQFAPSGEQEQQRKSPLNDPQRYAPQPFPAARQVCTCLLVTQNVTHRSSPSHISKSMVLRAPL